MSRTIRFVIFAVGAVGVATLFAAAIHGVPAFGGAAHPYRDRAVAAALAHGTANVVSSVNFDQRGLDTLGEEVILLGSVLAASVLLRAAPGEHEHQPAAGQRVLPAVVLVGYLLLPVTLLVGLSVVAHGALTPGGGFQGGVVLATGSTCSTWRAATEYCNSYGQRIGRPRWRRPARAASSYSAWPGCSLAPGS